MALTDEQAALLSTTDLEVAWLRKLSSNYAPNTLSDLRALVMPDGEFFYWADTSGLTPAENYSLADHKVSAMQGLAPGATGSLTDLSRAFYALNLP